MTSRNPMLAANRQAILRRMRELYAAECSDAEAAAQLAPLWPGVTSFQVHGLAIALGLKSAGLKKHTPSLRRFSWQQEDAASQVREAQ